MNLKNKIATVFGGTGFIGRYIVEHLAREGATIKVVTRHTQSAYFLRTCGSVGQVVPFFGDYSKDSIDSAVSGSDIVINCLGILFEKGKSSFQAVHVDHAREIAESCARHQVQKFIHISALGIDESKSKYAKTKREGEQAVKSAFPNATILRPSVVFGPEDNFFNKFAKLSLFSPVLPLISGGDTRFQPVYVRDIAEAVVKIASAPAFGDSSALGQTYELAGPEVLSFKNIYEKLFVQTGRRRALINLPTPLARIQAGLFSILPTPPLTNDQITSLQTDNILSGRHRTLRDLGIEPTALDVVLPLYLSHYKSGGKFAEKKRA